MTLHNAYIPHCIITWIKEHTNWLSNCTMSCVAYKLHYMSLPSHKFRGVDQVLRNILSAEIPI